MAANYRAVITAYYPESDGTQTITEHTIVTQTKEQFSAAVIEAVDSL